MKTSVATEKDALLYRNNSLAVGVSQPQRGRTALAAEESEQEKNLFESLDGTSMGKRS